MTPEELNEALRLHKLWLDDDPSGKRAFLQGASLRDADLQGADLRRASLRGANLQGADVDYSAWPLWCGSLKAGVDDRIALQLLYHTLSVVMHSPYVSDEIKRRLLTPDNVEIANRFHRAAECGEIEEYDEAREEDDGK